MQITYRYRVKDKPIARLSAQTPAVNFVWNDLNATQMKTVKEGRKWLGYHDFARLTAGATKEGLDLHAQAVQQLCKQYDISRHQDRKPWLNWRKSKGARRSLGWIPFNQQAIQFRNGGFAFRGEIYDVFLHRPLPDNAKIGCGSLCEDSRGRWYINVPVEVPQAVQAANARGGIDLGLKTLATLSCSDKIPMPAFYRAHEATLATSQRARKSKRVRAIHAKIRNRRKDFLHKVTTPQYGFIAIGDVSPSKLVRTNMAKSVLDVVTMLSWKQRLRGGGMCLEVCEHLTTQTCSQCGCLPPSRPRGIAGLRIREWPRDDCGAVHDRDVNAARNILRAGPRTLVEGARAGKQEPGSPCLQAGE
jgi:transposase